MNEALRRVICLTLAAVMAVSMFPAQVFAVSGSDAIKETVAESVLSEPPPNNPDATDEDTDSLAEILSGGITVTHSASVQQLVIAGETSYTPAQIETLNVDGNTVNGIPVIDARDASLIAKYLVGLITDFPTASESDNGGTVHISFQAYRAVQGAYEEITSVGANEEFLIAVNFSKEPAGGAIIYSLLIGFDATNLTLGDTLIKGVANIPNFNLEYAPNVINVSYSASNLNKNDGVLFYIPFTAGNSGLNAQTLQRFLSSFNLSGNGRAVRNATTGGAVWHNSVIADRNEVPFRIVVDGQNHDADSFTVTFNPTGGTITPASKTVVNGEPYGDLPVPQKDGFLFDGWYTAQSGGTRITSTQIVNLTDNQILYAHWISPDSSCYIVYRENGGNWTGGMLMNIQNKVSGATITLNHSEINRDGYTLSGWSRTPDGDVQYRTGDSYSGNESLILYAVWTPMTFSVVFDADGGAVNPASKTVTYDSAYGTLPVPTRNGYAFNGWYTTDGEPVTDSTIVTVAPTTVLGQTIQPRLIARWIKVSPEITVSEGYYGTAETGYSFDVRLTSADSGGEVLAALYTDSGQMVDVMSYPASDNVEVAFDEGQEASCAKVIWVGENHRPMCDAATVDLYVPEIYSKALDEEHIAEGELEHEGETYTASYIDNQIIIEAVNGVTKSQIEQFVSAYRGNIVGYLETLGYYQIELEYTPSYDDLISIIATLKENELVADAYLNTISEVVDSVGQYYPDDSWGYSNSDIKIWDEEYPGGSNWGIEAMNTPSAWKLLIDKYGSIENIKWVNIGLIESLFDLQHEDVTFKEISSYANVYQEISGEPYTVKVAELAESAKSVDEYIHIIHGTHVAGIIAANADNGKGISGVAPNAPLYGFAMQFGTFPFMNGKGPSGNPVKTPLFGQYSLLADAIEIKRIRVLNLSQKAEFSDDDLERVTKQLKSYLTGETEKPKYDFVIVASGGNDENVEASKTNWFNAITDEEVAAHIIVVGSSMDTGFSHFYYAKNVCYGERIDVVAPGVNIYSTAPVTNEKLANSINSDPTSVIRIPDVHSPYCYASGTSMAAPYVAGLAALVWASKPCLSGREVKDIIVRTADIQLDNPDEHYFRYMVNAAHAVSEALGKRYSQGDCGEQVSWVFDSRIGQLTIFGQGQMTDFEAPDDNESLLYRYKDWYRYKEKITSLVVEDGVTSIGDFAFANLDNLERVTLGNSIDQIGQNAFANCKKLSELSALPASLTKIEENAFQYTSLRDVYFAGQPPTMLLDAAKNPPFYYQTDQGDFGTQTTFHVLERNWEAWATNIRGSNVWYPAPNDSGNNNPFTYKGYNIMTYGDAYAWISCRDAETQKFLEGVNIQIYVDGETTLSGQTDRLGFCHIALENAGTYSLKASKAGYKDVTLSLELSSSSEYPQSFLVDMVSTTIVSGECGDNLTWKLGGNGLVKINGTGAMWDYAYDGKPWYPYRDQITSIIIEDGATSIGQFAFSHCSNLTSVTIPASVINIGSGAFTSCGALTDVAIPNSVRSIESSAFSYCVSLSSIRIPSGVSRIEPFTFTFCSSLESVDIPRSVTSIGEGAFNSCFALTDVHYSGTQAQWNSIQIDRRNNALTEADIHTA